MRVIIASPYLATMRGNTLTALRIMNSIANQGIDALGIDYNDKTELSKYQMEIMNSEIIHILNPVRYLQSQMYNDGIHEYKPYGITFTGTDLNVHLDASNEKLAALLAWADFIVVFHEQARDVFTGGFPNLASRVHSISQGYYEIQETLVKEQIEEGLVSEEAHAEQVIKFIMATQKQGKKVIVLPAGIRKVKRIPWAIQAVTDYQEKFKQQVVLCVIGPVIEPEEMEMVEQRIKENFNAIYFGDVPQNYLVKITKQADVVLNSSESEGQSLAIIEAFYQRTPVIASRCPGNEQMIKNAENGYLFTSEEELFQGLNEIFNKPEQADKMVDTAYQWALVDYSAEQEIMQYIRLYEQAIHKMSNNLRYSSV